MLKNLKDLKKKATAVRSAAGDSLVNATKQGKKALKEQYPDQFNAVEKNVDKATGKAWSSLIDYFEAQPEHIEIANVLSMLVSQRLKFHELAFKYTFKRRKPLIVLLTLMFKAHSLQHNTHTINLKPLMFEEDEYEDLRRVAMFPLNVYKVVEKEFAKKIKGEEGKTISKEWIPVDEAYIRERMDMIDEDKILYISQDDMIEEVECPRFIIFTDTRSKSISICVRGTTT